MKKSVVLIILVIYLVSIVAVGLFGVKMKVYNEVIYVDSITCISDDYVPYTKEEKEANPSIAGYDGKIMVPYKDGLVIELKCQIEPANATDKNLVYSCSDKPGIYEVVSNKDGTCSVKFLKPGTANVIVSSSDSQKKQIVIKVSCYDDIF